MFNCPDSVVAVEGVDGAISAWAADECNRVLGQELSQQEEEMHAGLVQEGKRRKLEASRCTQGAEATGRHPLGSNLENGGRREMREGASCGKGISGSGLERWIGGDLDLAFVAVGACVLSQCHSQLEIMESGHQECVLAGRWI